MERVSRFPGSQKHENPNTVTGEGAQDLGPQCVGMEGSKWDFTEFKGNVGEGPH